MNDSGVKNESDWNDRNVAEVREQGRKPDSFRNYRASKTLAEKGQSSIINHVENNMRVTKQPLGSSLKSIGPK